MATAAVTAISQFSSHQCLKKLSTLRQLIKHISLFEKKNTKFYFHFWIRPVFPASSCCHMLFPHCCFSVLLTFVLSHHFLAVPCLNPNSLTSAKSFSLFSSLKHSFYFLDFLPISSRSATPSPSKTAAGRAGRDRFAGESYTVLGKDYLPNPNQPYSSP